MRLTLSGNSLVAGLFLTVTATSLFSQNSGRDIVPIGGGDTIEVMRAKIAHNGYQFTVDHNWVFDMDPEMKREIFDRPPSPPSPPISEDIGPLEKHLGRALPSSFDLRNYGGHSYIGPIKSQGFCNSCVIFAAVAAAEGSYNWAMGLYDGNCAVFSESFFIWCLTHAGCAGAGSGNFSELTMLTTQGVCSAAEFPFTEFNPGPCEHWGAPRVYFRSWHKIPCNDIEAIKIAIITYGAVAGGVSFDGPFVAYSGGIYEDIFTTCPGPQIPFDPPPGPCYLTLQNHAVALVGWDDNGDPENNGYWILRNSFGRSWGESGYMRIKYRSARVACKTAYIVYATPTPTITPTGTPAPTATPTPAETPRLLGEPSSTNPSVGSPFTFGAVCRPLTDTFDAYGVAADQRGNLLSFDPRNPESVRTGIEPLARSVRGLGEAVQLTLYYVPSLPAVQRGVSYTFTLCLVPPGSKPLIENAIPGYLWQGTVTVR